MPLNILRGQGSPRSHRLHKMSPVPRLRNPALSQGWVLGESGAGPPGCSKEDGSPEGRGQGASGATCRFATQETPTGEDLHAPGEKPRAPEPH